MSSSPDAERRADEPVETRERDPHDADRDDTPGLFSPDERSELRADWERLQERFVEDPGEATRAADELVGDTIDRATRRWQKRRRGIRNRWDTDHDVDTEEMRTALQDYRDVLERLLAMEG